MLLRLVRPVKRTGTSFNQFKQRIPADIRGRAVGMALDVPLGSGSVHIAITAAMTTIRFSLRTRDPHETKIRQGIAAAYLETAWRALRQPDATVLTHKQAHALAGQLYRAWSDEDRETTIAIELRDREWISASPHDDAGEEAAAFIAWAERLRAILDADDLPALERSYGAIIDRLLLAKGIARVDEQSRPLILRAFGLAHLDATLLRRRHAEGDYSPDPKAERFPEFKPAAKTREASALPSAGRVSLKGLVEDWWREGQKLGNKPSTYESYRNTMATFVKSVGHDDASRVTPENVVHFKDQRLAARSPRTGKPISPKTVKDSDLAGLKTIFNWAIANRRMASNPAEGITLKLGKRRKVRSKGLTEDEAKAILRAALAHAGDGEQPQTRAAKRWAPWLCAFTGARVGEIAQLRKQDVRREGEHWVIHITPEAGTVKTDEARDVVLHAQLVELGFPAFAAAAPNGHLFLRPAKDGDVRGPWRGVKNRLAEFARSIVKDTHVAPNHGWRHRFKTIGREVGIDARILDAIQGQAPRTVAESYGDVTIKTIAAAIAKLPRIDLGEH